jgi:hypothetical protein
MVLGIIILALEVPHPVVKRYTFHRSFVARVVLLSIQISLNLLYYQVSFFGSCHALLVDLTTYPGNKCSNMVTYCSRMLLSGHGAWGNHEGNKGEW